MTRSARPRSFLGAVKTDGERELLVSQVELENGIASGVSLKVLGAGLVPLYEEHTARLERGITLAAWMGMDEYEKALVIAARRARIGIDNLQADAEIRQARRNAKKK